MPHGTAVPIPITKLERRALDNLRFFLEKQLDEYNKTHGHIKIRGRIYVPRDDSNYIPLLKIKAILLSADGNTNREIADQLQVAHTVGKWRNEFHYILSRDDLPFNRIKGYFAITICLWTT